MRNSPLVNYTKISPNRNSPRNHKIDTISIHCVVGQLTVEQIGDIFAKPSRGASSNYGIGKDGKIGMYVEEKDRSWCTSSPANDHRAITIEVASDTSEPYAVTPAAYNSLINLLVDICKRNNIKELKWKADKKLIGQVDKQNMTVHRWFANKSCPGEYLYSRHGQIAKEVNERLKSGTTTDETATKANVLYKVQVGAFANKANAEAIKDKLIGAGFPAIIVEANKQSAPAPAPKKSNEEIAKEILAGEWGNGDERKQKLEDAGYDYEAVQKIVNSMI